MQRELDAARKELETSRDRATATDAKLRAAAADRTVP